MRPTNKIDDPTWKDIHDRDKIIKQLKLELQAEKNSNYNYQNDLDEIAHKLKEIDRIMNPFGD